jgi:hypothetical protein
MKQGGSGGGSPERKKNIAADIGSAISQFVPLICGLSKQVTGSSSDFTKNKIETLDHDQLIQVLQTRLTEKRYCKCADPLLCFLSLCLALNAKYLALGFCLPKAVLHRYQTIACILNKI